MKNKETVKFYDTSALLGGAAIDENVFISPTVIDELEHVKTNSLKDEKVKYKARALVRNLMINTTYKTHIFSQKQINKLLKKYDFLAAKADSRIICEALLLNKTYNVIFITQDACQYLIVKERFPELKVEYYEEEKHKSNLWTGYEEITLSTSQLDSLYSSPEENILELNTHEYAIIHEYGKEDEISDIIKWNGKNYSTINYKPIRNDYFGTIKPRNPHQEIFFDLLQDHSIPIKLGRGGYGTGKSFCALVYALHQVQNGKFKKIVFIRNNIEVANSKTLGALPGTQYEKLLPFLMPIADILGSEDILHSYIDQGIIEPIHVGFLRGRSFSDSIIIVDEAENLTAEIVKLILGRVGEKSELILLGDEHQTDMDVFKRNGGIAAMINSLKGHELFGTIELQKPERSRVAEVASLIK